jgi:DNA-binding MarR family transcriptional regulator
MILHSIGTASVSEIAEHSIVKLSTMTKIIQRMEAEGFVSSAPAEHDRRVTMVTITAKGEEKGRAAWVESEKIKDRVFAGIALEDRDQMIGLLRKLSGQLSNY